MSERLDLVLLFVLACRSPEKDASPAPVASAAPVVQLEPSATHAASARATFAKPPPIALRDGGHEPRDRGDDSVARERAMLEGSPVPKKLAIDEATASADMRLVEALTRGSTGTDVGDAGADDSRSSHAGQLRSLSDFERDRRRTETGRSPRAP